VAAAAATARDRGTGTGMMFARFVSYSCNASLSSIASSLGSPLEAHVLWA